MPGLMISPVAFEASPGTAGEARALYLRALSSASEAGLKQAARREACLAAVRAVRARRLAEPGGQTHRLVAIGESAATVARQLAEFGDGREPAGVQLGRRPSKGSPPVVFMFTGLGAESAGMGCGLYRSSRPFRRELQRCDAIYRGVTGASLLSPVDPPFAADAPWHRTSFAQPAVFAFEYALAQFWRAAGIRPAAVIGYSLGEDVAACVAGVASPEDLLPFVIARAEAMERLRDDGGMLAVFADEGRVREALASHPDLAIAAVNGPENTVVSGPLASIASCLETLQACGWRARRVRTSHAFHSALMEPALAPIEEAAARLRPRAPEVPVLSTLTGDWLSGGDVGTSGYWSRRVRQAVRFSEGLERLYADGYRVFVEIGPHATLSSIAARCLPADDLTLVPTHRRGEDARVVAVRGMAALYIRGVDVRWPLFTTPRGTGAAWRGTPALKRAGTSR